jgi:hypothetical protein
MIFDSGQQYAGCAFTDCMEGARTHAIPVVRAQRGMHWNSYDGVSLDILAPSLPTLIDTGDDINENSIVTRLNYIDGSVATTRSDTPRWRRLKHSTAGATIYRTDRCGALTISQLRAPYVIPSLSRDGCNRRD